MKAANFIFYTLVGVCVMGMIYSNSKPDKTPQHTSTVSGSSGELNCGTSCNVKNDP